MYSSGQPGPVRTVSITTAGHRVVTGGTVTAKMAGGGWGEIKVISPSAVISNRAAYKLLCGGSSVGGVTVTAAVAAAAKTADCATATPSFTAAGSIEASKAETVTYYWAQSGGKDSAPATLTFTGPGTRTTPPLTIAPPAASGTGEAVLVVTSPVGAASAPATYYADLRGTVSHPDAEPDKPGDRTRLARRTRPARSRTRRLPPSSPVTPPTTSQPSSPPSQNSGGLALRLRS